MAIQGVPGSPQFRVNPQFAAENVAPMVLAQNLVPQDTVGITSKRQPGGGIGSGTRLSDLKPEQRASLGGGSALDTIAQAHPETTVGEVGPLLRNSGALEGIAQLMQQRNDLKVGDFISTDPKGRTTIDPSYKDDKVMEMLKERPDISPSELTAMRQNLTKTLKNPQMGKMAAEKSFELLKKRTDLKPEDMSKMMGSLHQTVAGDKQKGGDDQAASNAALDMFDNASKLMQKRTDIGPERMGELAKSVGGLSSPKDENAAQSISEGFEAASKSLEKNVLRSPEEMAKTASTIGEHFKGGDEKTAGHRMEAFKKSSNMMGENQSVDHNSLNKMLTQASQRDAKIGDGSGPDRAKRLGKVMDDVATGVKQGTVSNTDLSSHFRNQDAERARFQAQPDKKTQQKDGQKAQDKKEQGRQPQDKPAQDGAKPGVAEKGKSEKRDPLTASQKEEQSVVGPAPLPGQGATTAEGVKAAAKLGPGQAAGTKDAGVQPGTQGKPGKGGSVGPAAQNNLQPQPKKKA